MGTQDDEIAEGSPERPSSVIALELTIRQDTDAVPHTYTHANLPRREPCANPRCHGGGLDLHALLRWVDSGVHHLYCQGFENDAPPAPRARPCTTHFEVTIRLMRVVASPKHG